MESNVTAIIVSHNSERVLPYCLDALQQQEYHPQRIVIVDSGSDDSSYLEKYRGVENVIIVEEENIGFARANNKGIARLDKHSDYLLFVNPDAYLSPSFISRATRFMQDHPQAGIVSGKIYHFDTDGQQETGILDSTGVFRKWYGRWYDRGQGEKDTGQFDRPEEVPALCGAVMFCRYSALINNQSAVVFDPDFFLYKEDIELCLRLRKKGWSLFYLPELLAHHSRGWQQQRSAIPISLRRIAARSELLLYKKHPSPYMLWAIAKYLLVRIWGI